MLEPALSKVHRILEEARQNLSAASAAAVEQVYHDLLHLDHFMEKELAAIKADAELDERGKKRARRAVIEQAGRKFEVIKAKRSYSALNKVPAANLLDAPVEEDEPVLKFLREKEIRDRLKNMTEAQILSLFGESLFDGSNPLLRDAILNAPAGFEMLSAGSLAKMRQVPAKKRPPEMTAELDPVRTIYDTVEKIFALVKKQLDDLRRRELPASLTQSTTPGKRPLKF